VATTEPAWGYVDPSVMTYTIQALAGVAVALSALLGVVWRRVRSVLLRVLRIDENADKVVEPAVREVAASDPRREELLAEAGRHAARDATSLGHPRPQRLAWKARLVFSLVASVLLVFTVGVVAPLEIVAGSSSSLFFGVGNVAGPVAVFAVCCVIGLSLLMSLLRGRAFDVAFAVVVALGISSYVQVMLLNGGLPPADGNVVDWSAYTKATLVSGLAWVAIVALCVLVSLRKSLAFKGAASFAAVTLVAAQGIGLGMLLSQPAADGSTMGSSKPYVTMQGMMDVSEKSNVIVFVLDTFDTRYLDEAFAEDPGALDQMEGFTYYRNSVGRMIPTRYAMAGLLTGRSLSPDDKAFSNTLIRSWYAEDNLLDEAGRLGYSVGVYGSDLTNGMTALSQKTVNVHSIPDFTGNFWDTIAILGRCSLYRDLPWVLKPGFWFYTDEINDAIMPSDDNLDNKPWLLDDAEYYQELRARGLVVEDGGQSGDLHVIHMTGAHYPFTMDENAERVGEDQTSPEQQRRGSLKIVSEYLRQLKELGVYDQSTIVITADHGEWYLTDEIDHVTSPILLVKPAGAPRAPVQVSEVPTGHADLSATLVGAMGGDPSTWGTPVYDVPDEPRTRYYNATSVLVDQNYTYDSIRQWEITGDVLDWSNWHETGVTWPIVSD
jgi:hypothetical protein